MQKIHVVAVNTSTEKGTIKTPVDRIELSYTGVVGDAHAGPWNRQVSLLGLESVRKFAAGAGREVLPGEFAENITTEGVELWKMNPLDRLISGDLELEVTQIGKECHGSSCAIFRETGDCVMPKEGIFARVLHSGSLKAGDVLEYHPKTFRVQIITLSDRAYSQVYDDLSGPRISELLKGFFDGCHCPYLCEYHLIPDDPHRLEELLHTAKDNLVDLVITTGGTGIGPRDVTPDVVAPLLDRQIPGIMEMIRMKYGALKPHALLSRGVAGVMGKTLVFTLPGSVKGVNEYMTEINTSLRHMIYMLNGLDVH
jgi:molybdenum cofactor synthesis domain-containing protein